MNKKILLVDDDADFREAIKNLLEIKGYQVHEASNGAEGSKKALKIIPNLILLDVMMTQKSEGFDVARTLEENETTKNIPIIIISGIRREMNLPFKFEPNSEWLPVKAVLEKPVKPEELLKAVSQYIS